MKKRDIRKIHEKVEEVRWIPYEQYIKEKEWQARAERKLFIEIGLGWLVKFLDDARENNKVDSEKTSGANEGI